MNNEAVGAWDRVVNVDWLDLKAANLLLVSCPEGSEIDSFYIKLQVGSPHFAQSLHYDLCTFSTVHWDLPVNEGQIG